MQASPVPQPLSVDMASVADIERPHPRLWAYKALVSLAFGPLFPFAMVYYYLRCRTLRYRFDSQGISMSWGALRRSEINLAYTRIQDIHRTSGLIERWFGLSRIQIQTASGSSKPEMVIEGLVPLEPVQHFLEARLREDRDVAPAEAGWDVNATQGALADVTRQLEVVATELRSVRRALTQTEDA